GDLAEEGSLVVVAAALIPVVAGHGDERLPGQADEVRIGEGKHTARDTVVSGAAQRVPVHLPEQDRLALRRRLPARLPQAGLPGARRPPVLTGDRLDPAGRAAVTSSRTMR